MRGTIFLSNFSFNSSLIEFNRLCEADVGAADYASICKHFSCIYIHNIPRLDIRKHDIARRFITFIDEAYDAQVRLVWSAETSPMELFRDVGLSDEDDNIDNKYDNNSNNNNNDKNNNKVYYDNSNNSVKNISKSEGNNDKLILILYKY